LSPVDWDERATIGPRTGWFWDPLRAQHVARYLWAQSIVRRGVILDVACGTGYGSALLAGVGRRVLGVDVSAEAVAEATRDFASPHLTFVVGDAAQLPAAASSVDYVVSFETIEHLKNPSEFVAEIARVLRPNGTELLALLESRLVVREVLGQSSAERPATPFGTDQHQHWTAAVRTRAKQVIRVATGPVVQNQAIAHWLFPRIRHRHLPASSASGEYTYVVVRAQKP
jgi:ubiquinone/menaquinone biosynthesis C-methylase UbiE